MARGSRGFQGAYYKVFGVDDHELVVTGVEDITPDYRRVHFASETLLAGFDPQPASWVRLWIPDPADPEREVQRAYTFVDADAEQGTFALDFVLHHPGGPASVWAATVEPGATLPALVYGSTTFAVPAVEPAGFLLFGDPASLPGLRSVVEAVPDRFPIELYFEAFHASDRALPLPAHPNLRTTWVPHRRGGSALAEAVERRDWSDWYVWGGAEKGAIRQLRTTLQDELGFPKADVKLTVYWIDGKAMGGKSRGKIVAEPGVADHPEEAGPEEPSPESPPPVPEPPVVAEAVPAPVAAATEAPARTDRR